MFKDTWCQSSCHLASSSSRHRTARQLAGAVRTPVAVARPPGCGLSLATRGRAAPCLKRALAAVCTSFEHLPPPPELQPVLGSSSEELSTIAGGSSSEELPLSISAAMARRRRSFLCWVYLQQPGWPAFLLDGFALPGFLETRTEELLYQASWRLGQKNCFTRLPRE